METRPPLVRHFHLKIVAKDPVILRALAALVGGVIAVLWPGRTLAVVVGIVGIVLIVTGFVEGWRALRQRQRADSIRALLTIVVGAVLLVLRQETGSILTILFATVLAGRGLLDLIRAFRGRSDPSEAGWRALSGVAQILGALTIVLLGEAVVELLVLAVGVAWVVAGALALAGARSRPDTGDDETVDLAELPNLVDDWLHRRDMGDEARDGVVEKLVYEGAEFRRRVSRFAALMGFSTAIATLGIQTDSTAVVIGAMLVAPLMTPILATSASLLMGWPARAARSLSLVALGVGIAVVLSFLLANWAPAFVSVDANSQIVSRTSPTLLDLLIAIAAGAAGAYATCRTDVADSLPGVAIAVALVPPLSVVGITLEAGDADAAGGAMLLFLTNLVGIIAASGLVFVLVGFSPWSSVTARSGELRRSYTLVLIALLVVAIPLAITGDTILAGTTDRSTAEGVVEDWLADDPGLVLAALEVETSEVSIAVLGSPATEPDVDALRSALVEELGHDVDVILRLIPERRFVASG